LTHQRVLSALCAVLIVIVMAARPAAAADSTASTDRTGHLAPGLGFGFLTSTEKNTILGFELHGDYFVNNEISVGPLLQLGTAADFTLVGLSAQVKYTFDLPSNPMVHPNAQLGVGFVHTDDHRNQTSVLVPFGGGVDVNFAKNAAMTATLLIDASGLHDDLFLSMFFGFKILI